MHFVMTPLAHEHTWHLYGECYPTYSLEPQHAELTARVAGSERGAEGDAALLRYKVPQQPVARDLHMNVCTGRVRMHLNATHRGK